VSDQPLFIELFPIQSGRLPGLTAYHITPAHLGGMLAARFKKAFGGDWLWLDAYLFTDSPAASIQIEMLLDGLREQDPKALADFQAIDEVVDAQPNAHIQAQFVYHTQIYPLEAQIKQVLLSGQADVQNGSVILQHTIQAQGCHETPVISIGVQPRLLYQGTLEQYLAENKKNDAVGLRAYHPGSNVLAEISKINDDGVLLSGFDIPFPAAELCLALRREDLEAFEIPAAQAAKAMFMSPKKRADWVKKISDVLKENGIIAAAYNSRAQAPWFDRVDFEPSVVYGENRAFLFDPPKMAERFLKGGVYGHHPRFADAPVKIAAINTLDDKIDDFMEAMRRQLERTFGFAIDLIRERKVRVLSEKNLQSAVRAVEKEDPHIVLAFFPDAEARQYAAYLKSLVMGKGIASHVITEKIMNNPDAMTQVIMHLLGKTGNTLYALAEPLEYTHFVVGLDMVRESYRDFDRITAMARLYQNDGVFLRYILHQEEIDPGAPIPLVVIFPEEVFADKRAVIHRLGHFAPAELDSLHRWGQVLRASLFPVEIIPEDVPRLYSLEGGISQPPWGSIFRLNPHESILTTTYPDAKVMLDPLLIRTPLEGLAIESAVYSVLAWTLLHTVGEHSARLPLTIYNADQMAYWLSKGTLPTQPEGDMPFWL